jgi:alpha-tubulin suppressor-like RCC1 family protein
VTAGDRTTFIVTTDGNVFGWGFGLRKPVQIFLDKVTTVEAGGRQNCALRSDGGVWCWGFNNAGQLGVGAPEDSPTPTEVQGLPKIKDLAVGDTHACALTVSDEVWCWGANQAGQLGTGAIDKERHPRPSPVRTNTCR